MNILIAPDSFKESADAVTVADAIARGVRAARPDATVDACPMADGGEGTVAALVAATGGTIRSRFVRGPLGQMTLAGFGLLGDGRTAVVEMAAASGLVLVPRAQRDPTRTTTYGTGELIAAALDEGASRIIVGIGGSATTGGGAGMAQAMGYRFLDAAGTALPPGLAGGFLADVARIDAGRRDARLAAVEVIAACDVDNPLTGPRGAAAVYGPQKGATPEMVWLLDANLRHWADLIARELGVAVNELPGAGAAGGLGAGLVAFCGATLRSGIEIVIEAAKLADRIRAADLVITGEGRLDGQSMSGKTAIGVARLAKRLGVPAIAVVGGVGEGAEQSLGLLESYHAIRPEGMPLEEAFARVEELLESTTRRVLSERA
ncbi:MAG: Glycerate 3-kinase [Phycisphaerae bacterium]|nr:Glycerate 3-kinase [Phycisphaerae bacterium]